MIETKLFNKLSRKEHINIIDNYYTFVVKSYFMLYNDIKQNIQKIDKDLTKTIRKKDIKIFFNNKIDCEEMYFCIEKNKQKRRNMNTFYLKLFNKIIKRNI